MEDKKKVLLLGPAYPYRGGIADTQNYLGQNLNSLGHDIQIYTFTSQYPKWLFPGKSQFSDEKAPDLIPIKRKIHSYNPLNWSKVARLINEQKPDCVIFRFWTPFLAPCWHGIARRLNTNIKKISLVDNWIPHETKFWDKTLTKMFSNQMDGFATLSSAVANQISYEKPNVPIWKGFHPIADNLPAIISTKEARKSLGWPLDKKIVLFFGLIRKYKGLDLLIQAFVQAPLKVSNVILAIVGEAYEPEDKYTDIIKKYKLQDRVICDFNYANSQKSSLVFCAADVVAQTYISATQSGVTPLAYHYKTPLLVSNLPGLSVPIVEDRTGVITENHPKKIAKNLNKILQGLSKSNFKSAFEKTHEKYSWSTFGKSLMNFIDKL
tara:strand:+ start:425 stop:1561 length:1137 start_codon:yes stop_codon:yes gene_type:complete